MGGISSLPLELEWPIRSVVGRSNASRGGEIRPGVERVCSRSRGESGLVMDERDSFGWSMQVVVEDA